MKKLILLLCASSLCVAQDQFLTDLNEMAAGSILGTDLTLYGDLTNTEDKKVTYNSLASWYFGTGAINMGSATTWGDNTQSSLIWTWDPIGGTDPTLNISGGAFTFGQVNVTVDNDVHVGGELYVGGTAASDPKLKKSGSKLQVSLVDDSDLTELETKELIARSGGGAGGPVSMETTATAVVDGTKLGQLSWAAPLEADGGDAILQSAAIWAEADDTFSATVNDTDLVFAVGLSGAATEIMRVDSTGVLVTGDFTATGSLSVASFVADTMTLGSTTADGSLVIYDDDAGGDTTVTIQAKDATGTSYTLTLPGDDGTANQFLQTDGAGVLTWATGGLSSWEENGNNLRPTLDSSYTLGEITQKPLTVFGDEGQFGNATTDTTTMLISGNSQRVGFSYTGNSQHFMQFDNVAPRVELAGDWSFEWSDNATRADTGTFDVGLGRSAAGTLYFAAAGLTNNEDLTFDMDTATANEVAIGSSTGVNKVAFGSLDVDGQHSSPNTGSTLGAAATTFAISSNFAVITGDAGTNTIATITGGATGQRLTLLFVDALVTITDDDTHAADSVDLSAAFTSADDTTLELVYDGTSWYEISRSTN